jgi:tetratricopeptide (TPR) repeat protein
MAAGQTGALPDPSRAVDLPEFVGLLGELRAWAGMPSYRVLAKRVGPLMRPPRVLSTMTVADAFKARRRRLDLDLVVAIVRALGVDELAVDRWRQACIKVHARAKTGGAAGVFRQLPADLATFTGRETVLKRLVETATAPVAGRAATVVVSTIEGIAGIGKTQLAVHAAHELLRSGHYTDVQLFVNLRGFDPERPPADPSDVLDALLRQLEVPAQQIPATLDERAAMFRDRMSDRNAVIVLDNAVDEQQVQDLIPASPTCLVLITSRRSLSGLEGSEQIRLSLFSEDEAAGLLSRVIGAERVSNELPQARRIVRACGHLPLALSLAAVRLRARPAWSLADLADRLESAGLDEIHGGGRSLRPIFDLSYHALPDVTKRIFRALGHIPCADFTAKAVAAAAAVTDAEAERSLEQLLDENLVSQAEHGRYEMHDLLRALALDLARNEGTSAATAALSRLSAWYLHTTHHAAAAIETPHVPDPTVAPAGTPLEFADRGEALAWYDRERSNLTAVRVAAYEADFNDVVWQLAVTLKLFVVLRHHLEDFVESHRMGVHAARAGCDRRIEALMLYGLGCAYIEIGRPTEAEPFLTESITLYHALGDDRAAARLMMDLGRTHADQGRYREAIVLYGQALSRDLEDGDRRAAAITRLNIGVALYFSGDLAASLTSFLTALDDARQAEERRAETVIAGNIAQIHCDRHDYRQAQEYYEQQLTLSRFIGDRYMEAEAIDGLGDALSGAGNREDAVRRWEVALALFEDIKADAKASATESKIAAAVGIVGLDEAPRP